MVNAKDLKVLSSSLNILYAEDEEILREGMQSTLKKLFKNVFIAKNGQEAVEIFKKEDIDIILTDINMPIMDGIELITQINKLQDNPIIIVLSAHNESKLLQKLINIEVNNFLNKPVEKDKLIKILYKNASIVNNKKLLQDYSKKLEDENEAMARKNKILEQKLNQLARQTNKTQANNKTKKIEKNKIDDSYYSTILKDDKDELKELSQDLETYITMMFQNENLHVSYIEKLSNVYKKYASVLNSYPEFYEISNFLNEFSNIITVLDNKFLEDINQTGIYFESLQHTFETFRQNIFEKEAKNPRFYNASLINDIQLIIDFLENKESQNNEIEFF
ncbi:MAG: response regulator [Sulfurimonas sp.]|nr:response regulator [Sulfurimonas sp.]